MRAIVSNYRAERAVLYTEVTKVKAGTGMLTPNDKQEKYYGNGSYNRGKLTLDKHVA